MVKESTCSAGDWGLILLDHSSYMSGPVALMFMHPQFTRILEIEK